MSENESKKAVLELVASMERARQENKTSFTEKDKTESIVALERELRVLCNKYVQEQALKYPDCTTAMLLVIARLLVIDTGKDLTSAVLSMSSVMDVLSAYIAFFIQHDEDYRL